MPKLHFSYIGTGGFHVQTVPYEFEEESQTPPEANCAVAAPISQEQIKTPTRVAGQESIYRFFQPLPALPKKTPETVVRGAAVWAAAHSKLHSDLNRNCSNDDMPICASLFRATPASSPIVSAHVITAGGAIVSDSKMKKTSPNGTFSQMQQVFKAKRPELKVVTTEAAYNQMLESAVFLSSSVIEMANADDDVVRGQICEFARENGNILNRTAAEKKNG
jgi:hypothetical protein